MSSNPFFPYLIERIDEPLRGANSLPIQPATK
jgi:hypothetical protein